MKPEHTKPFDLKYACAGAPYCCRDGQSATILKWDGRHAGYPLVGIFGDEDRMMDWATDGKYGNSVRDDLDLVMIPLGMCEGKPVWWDDELISPGGTHFLAAEMRISTPVPQYLARCTWPKPAPQYPQTKMTATELGCSYSHADKFRFAEDGFRAIANAAIARSIQDGDVVPTAMLEKVAIAVRNECVEKVAYLDSKSGIYRIDLVDIVKAAQEGG